jgi:hypothetical protein
MATSPSAFLQLLLGAAPPAAGPMVAPAPAVPPPSTPPVAPAQPPPSAGSRFGDILRQLAPVLLANVAAVQGGPVAAAGLLKGYTQAQQQKRAEAEKQAALDAANAKSEDEQNFKIATAQQGIRERAAAFQRDSLAKLDQFTNPAERASYIRTAEQTAQQAFGVPPGWLSALPPLDTHAQDQKAAQAQLATIRQTLGKNFDAAIAHHATTTFQGKRIPISDLMTLAGEDVIDPATGQPLALGASEPDSAADLVTGTGDFANLARGRIRAQEAKLGRKLTPEEADNVAFGTKRTLAGMSGSGTASSDAIDAIADAIVNGEQPPTTTGMYRNTAALKAALARRHYNLTQATEDWNATSKYLQTLNGAQQIRLRQAVGFAHDSLDVLDNLAQQWDAGQFPALNKGRLVAAKQGVLGPQAQAIATKLDAQIADLVSELGTVYKGGNSSTDESLKLAAQNLSSNWSAPTLRSAIGLVRTNLQIRQNSIQSVGVAGASATNQYAPSSGQMSAAYTVDLPDGRVAMFKTQQDADAFRQKHGLQ